MAAMRAAARPRSSQDGRLFLAAVVMKRGAARAPPFQSGIRVGRSMALVVPAADGRYTVGADYPACERKSHVIPGRALLALWCMASIAAFAQAQPWPAKPVKIM